MRFSRSLRFRVAVAFAALGGVVSLVVSVGLYLGVSEAGERLVDQTLNAEMQDYLARRARNPRSLPPATATLLGYVSPGEVAVPDTIAALPPGQHRVRLHDQPYRLTLVERAGTRVYLLYNETLLHERVSRLLLFLAVFMGGMVLVSVAVAMWLTERVIEPVKELARRVREVGPDLSRASLTADFSRDEVGELASAFEQRLQRLAAFIERERAFTADVSHELRTPLAVIRGAAEVLLTDESRPDKERQRLMRIERAAADMADLSTALLAMAREQDGVPAVRSDLAELLQEMVDKHRHLLGTRQVDLVIEVLDRPELAADANLLRIVIANLVRNSLAYTERGSVHIRLEAGCLTVSDTGVGIPREALGKVFQRLYKGEASQGFGIGLSLVKKICDRYGWRIELESEAGQGTRATLHFPGAT